MKMGNVKLLENLIKIPSPSGFENDIGNYIVNELKGLKKVKTYIDEQKNVIVEIKGKTDDNIVIDAHADTIGFVVVNVNKYGMISLQYIGGGDYNILSARNLVILTENGNINGVVDRKHSHITYDERNEDITEMQEAFVDIGIRDRKKVSKVVKIGDPVVFQPNFYHLVGDYYCIDGNADILMSDYSVKKLKDITVGDEVLTITDNLKGKYRRVIKSKVLAHKYQGKKNVCKLSSKNNKLYLTSDHKVLMYSNTKKYRGQYLWKSYQDIYNNKWKYKNNNLNTLNFPMIRNKQNYLWGSLIGLIDSDGSIFKYKKKNKQYRKITLYQKTCIPTVEWILQELKIKCGTSINNIGVKYYRIPKKYHKKIDKYYKILKYDRDIMYGYINGFIIGDGYIGKNMIIINQNNNFKRKRLLSVLSNLKINYYLTKSKCAEIGIGFFAVPLYAKFCKKYNKLFKRFGAVTTLSVPKSKISYSKSEKIIDVYDITTDTGTFIANGFPVHNCGYGFDDKSACYIFIETIKAIIKSKKTPPANLIFVFSAQEETGGTKLEPVVRKYNPILIISLDVTFASDYPQVNEEEVGRCILEKGLVVYRGVDLYEKAVKDLEYCANKHKIPIQYQACGGRIGYNSIMMTNCNHGIKAMILGIPLRNMHSPTEIISMKDLVSGTKLLTNFLLRR